MLTPLHLALGLNTSDVTLDLVRMACDQRIKERDDLDWKSQLPLTISAKSGDDEGRNRQQDELSKDIAAMANTRGGLILFGVAEVRGTSEADKVTSVGEPDDVTLQNIRRVASSLIHPPVVNLKLDWLSDGTDTALAMQVPQGVEAPHLVRPRKKQGDGYWFAAPYRNGPDTEWMTEKMIESAYRDRLLSRGRREQDLTSMLAALSAATAGRGDTAWVVAVARPETPLPAHPRPGLSAARRVFDTAWSSPWDDFFASGSPAYPGSMLRSVDARLGFRKYRQFGGYQVGRANTQGRIQAMAEVHTDGSVGFAATRGGFIHPDEPTDPRFLSPPDLDQAILNLFVLARQAAAQLGVTSDYDVLVTVEAADGIHVRRPDPFFGGQFQPFSEDARIPLFQPVDGMFLLSGDLETQLASLEAIADDLANQTGSTTKLKARDLQLKWDLS